jgi:hypothetical protein
MNKQLRVSNAMFLASLFGLAEGGRRYKLATDSLIIPQTQEMRAEAIAAAKLKRLKRQERNLREVHSRTLGMYNRIPY